MCPAFVSSLYARLKYRFPEYFGDDGRRRPGRTEQRPVKSLVEEQYETAESWTRLKMAIAAPGLTYSEVVALDIFEFLTHLREVQAKNKKDK